MTSTHRVDVVPVVLEPHPNADALSIVRVWGFTVCVRTEDWLDRATGAYIQPDSVCPERPEFEFLGKHRRIRVKRLRGVVSMGLLMPTPEGANVGDDVAELLGVTRYEPPMTCRTGGQVAPHPGGYRPIYDVESARRYAQELFTPGEQVMVTEKIHGANGRWCFAEGRFHAGSRTEWKVDAEDIIWWQALHASEALQEFLREHQDMTVYGEVYGQVQDLKYGVARGVRVAVFDLLRGTEWLNAWDARHLGPTLPWVPVIGLGDYDWATVEALAEGPSMVPGADHVREGCVFKPLEERTHPTVGRVQLKIVGNGYLSRD